MDEVRYELIRSKARRRTLTLSVERDGRVVMRVPWRTSLAEAECFFAAKRQWVEKKLAEQRSRPRSRPKRFRQGEEFLYLGRHYPLLFETGDHRGAPLVFTGLSFLVSGSESKRARELLDKWYRDTAKIVLRERVHHLAAELGLRPAGLRFMTADYRWGSCGPDDRVTLNWRLVMAPPEVIDYVVVHELLHISEKNHSKSFWQSLGAVMPDYGERKKWLEDYGHTLRL